MNIQMILSALPTPLSGKPDTGAGQGQFALALSQAATATPDQAGNVTFAAQLSAMPTEGLPPPTMAAQQALLQALNGHAGQRLDGEAESALPDAELREIMARLALIEGSSQAPALPDAALPADQQTARPVDEMSVELAEHPQAAALMTAAVTETQRPGTAASPGMNLPGERAAQPGQPAAAAAGHPLTASLAASAAAAAEAGDGAAASARPADFANALAKAPAPQPTAELRATTAETPRGGFIPDAATMTQATTGPTAPAHASAQPAPPPVPVAQASLAAPLQSPAWPSQLGQQLVQFARQGGEQQVEMRLNPAELGPLTVTLKMTEQGAQAQFLSAHAQVRQVLEQAIPQLREALAEQGISLGETSVGEQRKQDAQAFAGRDGQRGQGGATRGEDGLALPDGDEPGVSPSSITLPLDGRVNLYA
ncbi:hypothetical protein HNO51_12275 [Billgrantia sulfidoxydans]|uniref:Flagellar hook-length control protein-like C-terminal domain-containing protein n=1 Tax=Billgrantia sulfidoxydans TaxID=2733484 RepID=A0ABX7W735_9GAMM|nr:flagellar hook-length control protein FliK [Halomonas sulfidoxydans]QTP55392.1 hypothetical protein HNO51_12275 [Halomonas sulfidoxydans]